MIQVSWKEQWCKRIRSEWEDQNSHMPGPGSADFVRFHVFAVSLVLQTGKCIRGVQLAISMGKGEQSRKIEMKDPTQLFFEGIDWHELVGRRSNEVRSCILQPSSDFRVITICLVISVKEMASIRCPICIGCRVHRKVLQLFVCVFCFG